MEYIPGIKVTNVEALDDKGIDRQKLVIDVHKVFFTMLLRHSLFHADPHPGNISVTNDGKLILYDYGMVGKLDDETRLRLIRLYLALVEKDPPRTVNAMDDLGMLTPDFNRSVIVITSYSIHYTKLYDVARIDESTATRKLKLRECQFPFRSISIEAYWRGTLVQASAIHRIKCESVSIPSGNSSFDTITH